MIEVTCAIILNKNKFLVAQRDNGSDHPLMWEFPGGKVKFGESHEMCIHREIKEELEIEIEILEKLKSVQFNYGFKKVKLVPFLCKAKTFQLTLNEHIQYKWIQMNSIKGIDLLQADLQIIQHPQNQNRLEKYLGE